jgi:hypothetical protein
VDVPLPWERLLWSGRPFGSFNRERYLLTDLRLVRVTQAGADEILLSDISDIQRKESPSGRLLGLSTLHVWGRDRRRAPLKLRRLRRGAQVAALLEWLATEGEERRKKLERSAIASALAWDPRPASWRHAKVLISAGSVLSLVFGVAIALHGKTAPAAAYSPDDAIYPNGQRRSDADVFRFMREDVMPWARRTIGPLKGGPDRVTCETCHGRRPELREWRMPAVAALPQPNVAIAGWERFGGTMDNQMRNAIYGYLAEADKQATAAYMREVVMPGMARLLHRPAYDFTRTYAYNRSHAAFGCYHCHQVQVHEPGLAGRQ